MKQKNVLILVIIWMLVMVSIVASTVTLLASGRSFDLTRWVSHEEYEMIERYARLEEVRSALSEGYYQGVTDDTLITGALKGMMASVEDPYTFYYTPDEMRDYQQQNGSGYHGVGLLIQNNMDGFIEVIRVYSDGPAARSGVEVGDLIIRVDGAPVSGASQQTLNEAVSMMKGEDESVVRVSVLREGEEFEFDIVRGDVNVSNVTWQILENQIGYINIFQFTGDDVTAFESALNSLQMADVRGLVIDLRNNPGGILGDVVAIADMLLPEGVIVYTEDREGVRENYYSDGNCIDLPLAVLVNDMSASAAEILAAAVQDHDRGTLVGEKTYGKGIVQTVIQYEEDGAGMQYTSSRYFTPAGVCIHGLGVTPDIPVEAADGFVSYSGIADLENDTQLQTALEAVRKETEQE